MSVAFCGNIHDWGALRDLWSWDLLLTCDWWLEPAVFASVQLEGKWKMGWNSVPNNLILEQISDVVPVHHFQTLRRLCVFRNCTPCSYWEPPPLVISCLTFPAPECFTKSDIAAITWWESRLCISLTFSGQALLSWQGQFCGVATWRGGKNTRFTFYYECGHMPGSNSES